MVGVTLGSVPALAAATLTVSGDGTPMGIVTATYSATPDICQPTPTTVSFTWAIGQATAPWGTQTMPSTPAGQPCSAINQGPPPGAAFQQPGTYMICAAQAPSTTGPCQPYTINAPPSPTPSPTPADSPTPTTSPTTTTQTTTTKRSTPAPIASPSPSPSPTDEPAISSSPIPGGKGGAGEAGCNARTGRIPTAGELAFWDRSLAAGGTDQDVEIAIVGSQEYYRQAGGSDVGFIIRAYADLLRLIPSAAQVGTAQALINGGADGRAALARNLVLGRQHESRWVVGAYVENFAGRSPTPDEELHWLQQLPHLASTTVPPATSVEAMIETLQSSPEFFLVSGASTDGFFARIFQNDLNRSPGSADTTAYADDIVALNNGGPDARSRIVHRVLTSREYVHHQVRTLYQELLYPSCAALPLARCVTTIRRATTGETSKGLATLADGSQEDLVSSLVASDEYFVNHGRSAAGFVRAVYLDLLDRVPSATEVTAGLAAPGMDTAGRHGLVQDVVKGEEYRGHQVDVWYHLYQLRVPRSDERTPAVAALAPPAAQPASPDDAVVAAMMSSDEYLHDAGGSPTGFVAQAHGDLLGVPATAAEEAAALSLKTHDRTWRTKVITDILSSPDYRAAFVRGGYERFLSRNVCAAPTAATFRFPGGRLAIAALAVVAVGGAGALVARRRGRLAPLS